MRHRPATTKAPRPGVRVPHPVIRTGCGVHCSSVESMDAARHPVWMSPACSPPGCPARCVTFRNALWPAPPALPGPHALLRFVFLRAHFV